MKSAAARTLTFWPEPPKPKPSPTLRTLRRRVVKAALGYYRGEITLERLQSVIAELDVALGKE